MTTTLKRIIELFGANGKIRFGYTIEQKDGKVKDIYNCNASSGWLRNDEERDSVLLSEVLRGQTDRDKLEQIFKNREKLYLCTVLSVSFLPVVCLLIIFL